MAIIDLFVFLAGFGAGGAVIWYYKSKVQAGVVAVNAGVVTAKADAAKVSATVTNIANDIKKV
jgi:hypothetical protein